MLGIGPAGRTVVRTFPCKGSTQARGDGWMVTATLEFDPGARGWLV